MLLLGTKNITSQIVPSLSLLNIGSVYRRFDKKGICGLRAFEVNGTSISLQQSGFYHITATATFTGAEAGDVTLQLLVDGQAVDGAFATETITTADTEFRSVVVDYYVLVDKDNILGNYIVDIKSIAFQNTGTIEATFTSFIVNVDKVV